MRQRRHNILRGTICVHGQNPTLSQETCRCVKAFRHNVQKVSKSVHSESFGHNSGLRSCAFPFLNHLNQLCISLETSAKVRLVLSQQCAMLGRSWQSWHGAAENEVEISTMGNDKATAMQCMPYHGYPWIIYITVYPSSTVSINLCW